MWVRQEVSTAIAMERNLTYLYGTLFPCETWLLDFPQLLSERETSDNGEHLGLVLYRKPAINAD